MDNKNDVQVINKSGNTIETNIETENDQRQKIPTIVKAGLFLGVLCLLLSIGIVTFAATTFLGGRGAADIAIIFALPVLIPFPIGIAVNMAYFIKIRKQQNGIIHRKSTIIAAVSLAFSLSFLISIPLFLSISHSKIEAYEAEQAARQITEETAKKAYETEPSIINQIISYTECFNYKESAKYRGARDAICGYLRYVYSNNWQEPLTGEQLIDSGYVPSYFKELSSEKSVEPVVVINNQAYEIEISRDNIGDSYLITPHQSCSKEENDGLISVWYTDYGSYENGQGPQEFICMYYDYHEDTNYAKLNKYEDTSFNIYSSDFKDFYEKVLQMLYNHSKNNPSYQFSVPYRDVFLYNNAEFINSFFSAWPDGYLDY